MLSEIYCAFNYLQYYCKCFNTDCDESLHSLFSLLPDRRMNYYMIVLEFEGVRYGNMNLMQYYILVRSFHLFHPAI